MRGLSSATAGGTVAAALILLLGPFGAAHAQTSASISVTPTAAIVGATVTVSGSGFTPNAQLSLQWASVKASWLVQAIPTPQVTGVKTTPVQVTLGSAETNSSGAFTVKITTPSDYGGTHYIQAFAANGTALAPKATFTLEPSFHTSPTSGPDGTPIKVTATGLGYTSYSTSYHLYWDNTYVGYMTALTTGGSTNTTFYASGPAGVHYIAIYQGYPGPGYLNPQQGPPSSETQSIFENYIPYYANFTVTPEQVVLSSSQTTTAAYSGGGADSLASLALLLGLVGGGLFVSRKEPRERRAISKSLVALAILVIVVVASVGIYAASSSSSGTTTTVVSTTTKTVTASSSSQSSSVPQVTFTPVATVVRPQITVPQNNATSGPRITVTPDIASVGENITVNGLGFVPNSQLPLVWTTRSGSNLLGYKLVNKSLRNVTASSSGSFSFTMKVPPDLGGIHYIAAGNLTENSNGTLFIQRSARISTTSGSQGTEIQIIMQGVGWDFNTNIATVDYDNSYIGYGCGFNSGGNVTFTIFASGSPGIQTIDVFPSVWWGPSDYQNQSIIEYRYPILTPQDQPELMPSFHFTFLMTSSTNSTQSDSLGTNGGLAILGAPLLISTVGIAALTLVDSKVEWASRARVPWVEI